MRHVIRVLFDKKIEFILFVISVFLLRLPPVYLLPIQGALFNSHSIARYLIIFLLTVIFIKAYKNKQTIVRPDYTNTLIVIFFVIQSLSILSAVNISSFFLLYKHWVFSILVFFLTTVIVTTTKKFNQTILLLIITIAINVLYEVIVYLFSDNLEMFSSFFYDKHWDVVELNALRERYFVDIYDSALIPLLLVSLIAAKRTWIKGSHLLLLVSIVALTYLSNFRTQFLMAIFAMFISAFVFLKKSVAFGIVIFTLAALVFMKSDASVSMAIQSTTLDRLLNNELQENGTLAKRFDLWNQAYDMGLAYPIFGVGLRNYYDYLDTSTKNLGTYSEAFNRFNSITLAHPHNIFFGTLAETGFIGLFSLVGMLGWFCFIDLKQFSQKKSITKSLIISFWVLFSFSLLNPPDTLPYLMLFFLLRGLIVQSEKVTEEVIVQKQRRSKPVLHRSNQQSARY